MKRDVEDPRDTKAYQTTFCPICKTPISHEIPFGYRSCNRALRRRLFLHMEQNHANEMKHRGVGKKIYAAWGPG